MELEFSESDRRDFLRKQIIRKCVDQIYANIKIDGATRTPVEKRWFIVTIARELLKSQQMDAQMALYQEEIRDAEGRLK